MKKSSSNSHKKAHKAQIMAVLLCVVCLGCVRTLAQDDVVQRFEQIAALIRDNRVAEAEKELAAVLRVAPDLLVALNLMGTMRAKQGKLNEAELLFLKYSQNYHRSLPHSPADL